MAILGDTKSTGNAITRHEATEPIDARCAKRGEGVGIAGPQALYRSLAGLANRNALAECGTLWLARRPISPRDPPAADLAYESVQLGGCKWSRDIEHASMR